MTAISDRTKEELAVVYVVANTPRYLYKRLRSHPLVRKLSEELSIDELISVYDESRKKKQRSIQDVALAYAALVAMGYAAWAEVSHRLSTIDTRGLDWATDIVDILTRSEWATKIMTVDLNQNRKLPFQVGADRTTSTSTYMRNEPLIKIVRV